MGWEKEADAYSFTLKDLMIARGKRIKKLLLENGVKEEQLTYKLGSHRKWKYQRYVTFVLNEKE